MTTNQANYQKYKEAFRKRYEEQRKDPEWVKKANARSRARRSRMDPQELLIYNRASNKKAWAKKNIGKKIAWEQLNPGMIYEDRFKPSPEKREAQRLRQNAYMRKWLDARRTKPKRILRTPEQKKQTRRLQRQSWEARNPEKVKLRRKLDYQRNKAKRMATAKKWREANPELNRKVKQAWEKSPNGKEHNRHSRSKRRAIINGCEVKATAKEVKALMRAAKSCRYCGCRFTRNNPATLDHVIALAKGGSHSIENLTAACGKCNSSKCARDPQEFARNALGLLMLV